MKITDLIARAREQEEHLKLQLVRQQGRVEGLQEALSLANGVTLQFDPSAPSVIIKTPPFVGPTPTVEKPAKTRTTKPPVNTLEARDAAKQLRRERIQRAIELLTAESPLGPNEIARRIDVPPGSIHRLLDDPAFARQPDGRWALAVQTPAPVEPAKPEPPKVEPAKPAEPKPAPKAKPAKPVSENTRAYWRHKIAQTLSGGSLTLIEVARKVNLTYDDALEICQDDPWFSQDNAGRWHITPQCRSEFFDDSNPATGD